MPSNELTLVATGAGLGVIHILTGPDHLSALATISSNVKSPTKAFFLGFRWGVGHSLGLVLVALILLLVGYLRDKDDFYIPESVNLALNYVVGCFMIFLGFYYLRRAWNRRKLRRERSEANWPRKESPSAAGNLHEIKSERDLESSTTIGEDEDDDDNRDEKEDEEDQEAGRATKSTMAICAGIFQGMAGPGGVLGVIPAVQLQDGVLASIYLATFCICSTITMGIFAVLYGCITSALSRRGRDGEYVVDCFSAGISIAVGIAWITLVSLEKLNVLLPNEHSMHSGTLDTHVMTNTG